ncbi:MAG: SDR family oxidoreductase [Gammaproteobacteria bacterium]|nr:SDR family oxidoreductase [Gammaproteobacteria bacterium]
MSESATRVALITGASRGIGAATAVLLGARGYKVGVNYQRRGEDAERVVAAVRAAGGDAIALQADIGSSADIERMFGELDERFGPLTALVNNAGISGPKCRLEGLAVDQLELILRVNVIGTMVCTQQAVKRMSTRHGGRGGSIVNVSSGAAHRGNANSGIHYAVSKGAVNSFTIGASQELGADGIRVSAVSPGLTRTEMPDPARFEKEAPGIPMGRVGEPEEIARAIVWLLSDDASYVSGANLRVAGGRP